MKHALISLYVLLIALLVSLWSIYPATAQPTCIPKDGRDRIPKHGTCPTGYRSTGNCCEAMHDDTTRAFPKEKGKACPSGTYASSDYCKRFR